MPRQGDFCLIQVMNFSSWRQPGHEGKNLAILSAKNRYFVLYSVLFTVSQVHERFAFR